MDVLHILWTHCAAHRYPPTIREICKAMGITSTNGVAEHLRYLEHLGCISRGKGARAITVQVDPTQVAMRETRRGRKITDGVGVILRLSKEESRILSAAAKSAKKSKSEIVGELIREARRMTQ
jgi:SOS-response transcriptional repressor LexA